MNKENIKKTAPLTIIVLAVILAFGYQKFPVFAQSSGGVSTATLIGGETKGITGACCNGLKLEFDSVKPSNIFILDGEALWTDGISQGFDHDNQTSSGYCALGKLRPALCFTIISECETSEYIPFITLLGTGGTTCSLGL